MQTQSDKNCGLLIGNGNVEMVLTFVSDPDIIPKIVEHTKFGHNEAY